ncbi:MAG: hypothetical protein ACMXYE_01555 [Candidatus Woesearchaeota archaeon]
MADIVYKRSLYDRLCRTAVGIGLIYGAFNAGQAWQDYKQSQIPYQVINAGKEYLLMEQQTRRTTKIDPRIFTESSGNKADLHANRSSIDALLGE